MASQLELPELSSLKRIPSKSIYTHYTHQNETLNPLNIIEQTFNTYFNKNVFYPKELVLAIEVIENSDITQKKYIYIAKIQHSPQDISRVDMMFMTHRKWYSPDNDKSGILLDYHQVKSLVENSVTYPGLTTVVPLDDNIDPPAFTNVPSESVMIKLEPENAADTT